MDFEYQIAIFTTADNAEQLANILQETIKTRVRNAGCNPAEFIKFFDHTNISQRNSKAPLVAAYINMQESPPQNKTVAELISEGVMVVPVVKDLKHYTSYVFPALLPINGMEHENDDPKLERVAGTLLDGLGFLPKKRRLFISYCREEARGVAIQLYEALDSSGFDVFLDTHCVRPGEPFQEILWHRLADTEIMILLGSPEFPARRWPMEEFARANSTSLYTLQLVWPKAQFLEEHALSESMYLTDQNFIAGKVLREESRLDDATVQRVVIKAESLRARAFAARQAKLVQGFCKEASDQGLLVSLQYNRVMQLKRRNGGHVMIVPATGIPDAVQYQEGECHSANGSGGLNKIYLLYDESGVREKWVKHLEWLDNQNLHVRSLQIAKTKKWMESL